MSTPLPSGPGGVVAVEVVAKALLDPLHTGDSGNTTSGPTPANSRSTRRRRGLVPRQSPHVTRDRQAQPDALEVLTGENDHVDPDYLRRIVRPPVGIQAARRSGAIRSAGWKATLRSQRLGSREGSRARPAARDHVSIGRHVAHISPPARSMRLPPPPLRERVGRSGRHSSSRPKFVSPCRPSASVVYAATSAGAIAAGLMGGHPA